eukprot:11274468-Karenia_brevis.AAC.1
MPNGTQAALEAYDGIPTGSTTRHGPGGFENAGGIIRQGQGARALQQIKICMVKITRSNERATVWLAKLPYDVVL